VFPDAKPLVRALTALVLASQLWGSEAWCADANPQMSVGLTLGGGAANLRTRPLGVFHMGLRADVLLLRAHDKDMGIGPYVEALTVAFETFEVGGGVSWLIPVTEHVPLVLSAGAHARGYEGGWEPGVEASLWMGSRSVNFESVYGLAIGVFVEGRYGLGQGQQADILGGVQLDLELFALPFVLLYNAVR
jgi:hypothetical protein